MPRSHRALSRGRLFSRIRQPALLVLCWSLMLGWGLAQAIPPIAGTVDGVTDRYRLGQQFYLENCATCHVGLPPAVMPTQTWADLLQDEQHYGVQVKPLTEPSLQIVWSYVSTYSRPIIQRERVPYRLSQSRYFKALHPKVEFTDPITPASCIACHTNARQYDYRTLSPEWQDAP